MIWSVSTFERRRATARPVCTVIGSTSAPLPGVRRWADRREVRRRGPPPGHGGGRCDQRRDQVGAPALALPALEVAVGRRGAALPRRQLVGVHAQAHGTARLAPLGAEVNEDL